MQEKKLQQELERQKEEDEQKKKIRKPKQGPGKEEPALKKSQLSRQVAASPRSSLGGGRRAVGHGSLPSVPHVSPPESCPNTAGWVLWWSGREEERDQHRLSTGCVLNPGLMLHVVLLLWASRPPREVQRQETRLRLRERKSQFQDLTQLCPTTALALSTVPCSPLDGAKEASSKDLPPVS